MQLSFARKILTFTCAGLLLCVALAQDTQPARRYSTLTYPSAGRIKLEQGTIELWIRPDVDLTQPVSAFYQFFVLRVAKGEKSYGDQGALSLMWLTKGGMYVMANDGAGANLIKIRNLPRDARNQLQWQPGQWHHVALSWNGQRVRLYTDGELLSETEASHPLPIATPGFINVGHGDSPVAVDELVVSAVERSAEEIRQRMSEAPARDEHTLLLDSMESLDAIGGRVSALRANAAALVEGKFGQAIQLYQ